MKKAKHARFPPRVRHMQNKRRCRTQGNTPPATTSNIKKYELWMDCKDALIKFIHEILCRADPQKWQRKKQDGEKNSSDMEVVEELEYIHENARAHDHDERKEEREMRGEDEKSITDNDEMDTE